MFDQYAVVLAMLGSFFAGFVIAALWNKMFKGADIEEAKKRIYDFVISMDEKYPDIAGPEKKRRVLALIKTYVPGVSEELASVLVDSVVGLWRFETEDIAPRERNSARQLS